MKIACLVSGGVDSSVALNLLKEEGHDITAFYLKIWLEDELSFLGECPWEEDLAYVRKVCKQAGVPLKVLSLQKEYWDIVVKQTIGEIKKGRTPNPDIMCNQCIKFGMFDKKIDKSYEKIATGHYANKTKHDGLEYLSRTPDPIKDQTYFLADLTYKQLQRALFPLGKLKKEKVRELAASFKLPNKDRKDSQGICFLGQFKFNEFIKQHLGEKEGNFVEYETGRIVGKHQGYWFFTTGQRKGMGLGHGPWYVVAKDPKKNIVYISNKFDNLTKERTECIVSEFNWITKKPTKKKLSVKIRHGPKIYPCEVTWKRNGTALVKIKQKDQGMAPGQFAVFYDGKRCLGGGVIQ